MKWYGIIAFLVLIGGLAGIVIYGMNPGSPSISNSESEKLIERMQNIQDDLTIFATEEEVNQALNEIATDPVTLKICAIAYENSQNPPDPLTATKKELEEFMENGRIMNELFCFFTKDMWYKP